MKDAIKTCENGGEEENEDEVGEFFQWCRHCDLKIESWSERFKINCLILFFDFSGRKKILSKETELS